MNKTIIKNISAIILIAAWSLILIKSGALLNGVIILGVVTLLFAFLMSKNKFIIFTTFTVILFFVWKYFESSYKEQCSFLNCSIDLSGVMFIFGVPAIAILLLLIQLIQYFIKRNKNKNSAGEIRYPYEIK